MKRYKKTVCPHDCPNTCSIVATVENGKVIATRGDKDHPFTRGILCHKVLRYKERIYSPDRVLYPMRNVGEKGKGNFERITWDEAIELITDKLNNSIKEYGSESIYSYKGSGNMGLIQSKIHQPLFNKLGASQSRGSLCCPAADKGWEYTIGNKAINRPESIAYTDLFIVWGMNMATTNIHMLSFFNKAKENGAKMVVIDPYYNRTAKLADWYIPIKPGTDAALALGMMHILVEENLIDEDYINQFILGFDELKKELPAYSPERVEKITEVPAMHIIKLARMYGKAKAPFIRMGMGLSRNRRGGMSVRAISCLPGLVGAYHKEGGGAFLFSSGAFPLNMSHIERKDLLKSNTRVLDKVKLGHDLLERKDPPIHILFITGGNPVISSPNAGKVIDGLLREDLFTIVHEQFMTDTALYADLLLPATTSFESYDVFKSYGHTYLQKAEPVINPLGEAWDNHKLYTTLAQALGFKEEVFTKSIEQLAIEMLPSNISELDKKSFLSQEPIQLVTLEENNQSFGTKSGKIELYSETMIKEGLPEIPTYHDFTDEEEVEGNLQLLTPPAHFTLNSSFGGVESLVYKEKKPHVKIHPHDAIHRGIYEDGYVSVFNHHGNITIWAKITKDTNPGVIVVEGSWWVRHTHDGNSINLLTSNRLTDMGWGSTLHDNRVFVKRL